MKQRKLLKNFKKETVIRLTDLDLVKGKGDVANQTERFTCGGDRTDCFAPATVNTSDECNVSGTVIPLTYTFS